MKNQFFKYELKYWLKNLPIYFYLLIFNGVAMLYFVGSTDGFNDFEVTGRFTKWYNSTFEILYVFNYFNKFFLFLIPSIIGYSLYRDSLSNTHQIMYSFPVTKRSYLFGKFGGSFLVAATLLFLVVLNFALAKYLPGLNPDKIGPLNIEGFVYLLGFYILPNLLIYGLFVFSVIIITRNIYSGFGVVIAIFFLQSIIENLAVNNLEAMALLDPLAQNSYYYVTRYWDALDRNTAQLPMVSMVLYNRLLYLGIALVTFFFAYRKFEFHQEVSPIFSFKKAGKRLIKENFSNIHLVQLTKVKLSFDVPFQLRAFVQLVKSQVNYIFRSPLFLVMLGLAILTIVFSISKVTAIDSMGLLPETRIVLYFPSILYKVIVMLLTFLYSGMLIHRERKSGINELVDIVPVPTSLLMLSKFMAIIVMQITLLFCLMFSGMFMQVFNGFYEFEIGLYIKQLFGIELTTMVVWAMVAFFTHSFLKNSFVVTFLLLGFWVLTSMLSQFGVETNLFSYNKMPLLFSSYFDGYGHNLGQFILLESYWFAFGLIILTVAYLLFNRGLTVTFKDRLNELKLRLNLKVVSLLLFSAAVTLLLGFKIYNIEQHDVRLTTDEKREQYEEFQANFSKYDGYSQPRIIATRFEMDLFPKQNSFIAKGYHVLQNKTNKAIDTLLVTCSVNEITTLESNGVFEVIEKDENFQFYVLKLNQHLNPKDSIRIAYVINNKENTLLARKSNALKNGTFLEESIFPRIGFQDNKRSLSPEDESATANHFNSIDSDRIYFDGLISTDSSQTAVTSGELINSYVKEDRAYFHYKTKVPVRFSLGIYSGDYIKYQENFMGVNLEIVHDEKQSNRIVTMTSSIKAALEYGINNFADYSHNEIRVVGYSSFGGSSSKTYANTIATPELVFSQADGTSEKEVNKSFYNPAFAISQHWWKNQLLPANASGASLLCESIPVYMVFNILKEQLGEEEAMKLLRYKRKKYIQRQRWIKGVENPLSLVGNGQQYMYEGKGLMAFNSLSNRIGVGQMNLILKRYLECHKMKEAPYATSTDFISFLKEETPDSLDDLISDYFEKTVLHDIAFDTVTVEQHKNNVYQLNITLDYCKIVNSDTLYTNDWVECEIIYEDESTEMVQLKCDKQKLSFSFQRSKKPTYLNLDPKLLLIEKEIDDNGFALNK